MVDKQRRKKNACLNCGHELQAQNNFCPECGQENNDQNVSIWTLFAEFLSHFFAIDSKLGRSIVPFFIKPGFLTNRFNEGRRVEYVHPMRLYLVLSLFYFLVLGFLWKAELKDKPDWEFFGKERTENNGKSKNDETATKLAENSETEEKEVIAPIKIKPKKRNVRKADEAKSQEAKNAGEEKNEEKVKQEMKLLQLDLGTVNDLHRAGLSFSQITDSLNIQDPIAKYVAKQWIKLDEKPEDVGKAALQNLPAMMFVLLPVFALILFLLYIRHEHLYIHHLIHSIHLHCFAYLVYGFTIALYMILPEVYWSDYAFFWAFVIVTVYAFVSLRRVYKQRKRKTLVKFLLLGYLYLNVLILGLLAEFAISALLF